VIPPESVEALDTLLGTAARLIDELCDEQLLQRLIGVLGCILPEDREGVLAVLEHDANVHAAVPDENVWARFATRPNPFALLYTRGGGRGPAASVRSLEIQRAARLGVRMAQSLPPWGEGGWEEQTVRTWRALSPEARAYVIGMSQRVLAVLAANRRRGPQV
jgi:hypothetical protein